MTHGSVPSLTLHGSYEGLIALGSVENGEGIIIKHPCKFIFTAARAWCALANPS